MNRVVRITRAYALILVLAACSVAAGAQSDQSASNYTFTVMPDRPDALYHVGDTVAFAVRLLRKGEPIDGEVQWTISKDGVPPVQSGRVKLSKGSAAITGKLDEPGFLLCRATFPILGKSSLTALGGAGIDPLKIGPSLPVPDDFDSFWSEQKKALAAIPVNPRLTTVKSPQQGVECWDLQADSVGSPVSGYFAKPSGAGAKSLPIILLVHGAGVRSSSLGSAAGWAKQGFLALDLNAHGIPNGRPEEFYTKLAGGELKDYRVRGRESRDTVYFREMFLRLVRAIDFLTSQPEWNGRALVVHGSSQGGAQSLVATGLDPRVTFFAAGVPAMCDHTGVIAGRINGWPKFLPQPSAEKPDPKVIEAVRYYDAMNFATRTKAAGIVTVGFVDVTCPPSGIYATFNALGGTKEIFNDPPGGHAVSRPSGDAMRNAILRHVEERKPR